MPTFSRYSNEPNHWKDIHMGGGIQPGTTASSEESIKLDDLVGKASKDVYYKYKSKYDLLAIAHLDKSQIPFGVGACVPDGLIYIYRDRFIFSSEAKHQGDNSGNATGDRWYKNHSILRMVNPTITYLTFGSVIGKGEQALLRSMISAHLGEVNVYHPFYNTLMLSNTGFTYDQIFYHTEQLFIQTIEGINNNEIAIYVGRWKNKIDQALSTISTENSNYIL